MDNGQVRVLTGFRVQQHVSRGPGRRYSLHPNVTLDEVKALAAWDDVEDGCRECSFGGAKGGVICDPKRMSKSELGTDDAPIRERNFAPDWTGSGYSRAGRVHRRADDGFGIMIRIP